MMTNREIRRDLPILEFDPDRSGRIEPAAVVPAGTLPEVCVITFFADTVSQLVSSSGATQICRIKTTVSEHPVYEWSHKERRLALMPAGLGGPLAAGLLENAIAMGARYFVVCGGAGVLDSEFTAGRLILPTSALRDEGTSYHYLPPSREVEVSALALSATERALEQSAIPFVRGKTWSTDAFFRETRRKIELRRSEGCVSVEMEAASLLAVAKFRGVELGYVLYGGDSVAGEWDRRPDLDRASIRERLLMVSAEACFRLADSAG